MSKETFKNDDYIYKDNGVFTRTVASIHRLRLEKEECALKDYIFENYRLSEEDIINFCKRFNNVRLKFLEKVICQETTQYINKLKGEVVIVCQGDDVYEYWRKNE
jgi:hypothetical protein